MSWLVLWLAACGAPVVVEAAPEAAPSGDPVVDAMRERPIGYTRHARCRMDCRAISEEEVVAILMRDGKLDPSRSRDDGRCPSHALEGRTDDGQQVRIVYAACSDETRVVTAIDLGKEWPCSCD